MPNHCSNLLVAFDKDGNFVDLPAKYTHKEGEEYAGTVSLEAILPAPLKTGEGLIEWRYKHWGTKWDTYDGVVIDKAHLFDTAWAPPIAAITELSRLEPDLGFYLGYDEGGNDFGGYVLLMAGGELAEWNGDSCDGVLDEAEEEEFATLNKYTNPCAPEYALRKIRKEVSYGTLYQHDHETEKETV